MEQQINSSKKIIDDLYIKEFYMKDNELIFEEPDKPWIKIKTRDLPWWKHDNLFRECFQKVEVTGKWTINRIKELRLILKEFVISVKDHEDNNYYDLLTLKEAEKIMEFYDFNAFLTEKEMISLDKELTAFLDPKEIIKLRPPYDRMIIELDLMRKMGGYTREDLLSMSKKDIDKIFYLSRNGLSIPFSAEEERIKMNPKPKQSKNKEDELSKYMDMFNKKQKAINSNKEVKLKKGD